jgi:large subunit ribosomal protein L29
MRPKTSEMRQLDVPEMRQKIEALEKELYELRYQANSSQVEKPHRIKRIRREIAVYKTLIREKEMANVKQ